MNKKEICKEVTAIRKLVAQEKTISKTIRKRMGDLVTKACSFKPGDHVEWTQANGSVDRGVVHCVESGKIYSDPASQQYNNLWTVTVRRFCRGTDRFAMDRERIREADRKAALRAYVPPDPDKAKKRYRPLPWINLKTEREMFGIQISIEAGSWKHYAENGKPQVFPTKAARAQKLKELRDAARKP